MIKAGFSGKISKIRSRGLIRGGTSLKNAFLSPQEAR